MKTNAITPSATKAKVCFGVASILVAIFAIAAPFLLSPILGFEIDIYTRYVVPFVGVGLAILGFIRREQKIWAIIGLLLTTLYIGLHLVPST